MEKIINALKENEELFAELRGMWKAGADHGEMADAMVAAGIDVSADKVESMLSELQVKRAKVIGEQQLDDAELDQVAGGGDGICEGTATCDRKFKTRSDLPQSERCSAFDRCDEYLAEFL